MKKERTVTARWLLKRSARHLPALALITGLNVLRGLALVRFALASREVIDSAVSGTPEAFRRAILGFALTITVIVGTYFVTALLDGRTRVSMEQSWKARIYHVLLHSDYSAVSAYHSGELINRITSDVGTVSDGLISILPSLAFVLSRLIGAVIALAGMEPRFTLALACGGVFMSLTVLITRDRLKDLHKQVQASNGRLSGFLQETLGKLLMVQCTSVEDEVEKRAEALLAENWKRKRNHRIYSVTARGGINALCYLAEFAALLWCATRLMHGVMSFGTLTAVIQLVGQLEGPFANIAGFVPKYINMIGSGERLRELEDLKAQDEHSPETPESLTQGGFSLCAKDLCFAYGEENVLNNVSFTVPRNSMTVITGESGIGKSTLLKLMLGVYRPRSGSLYIQNAAGEIPLSRATRRLFSYVPQGNLLLSGSLRDNLRLTRPEADDQELWRALELSGLSEVIRDLPGGLDTQLGENAAGLSEGQAQRLSIARALVSGAPVLLLDEITSSLDEETERLVLNNLARLPDKTILAVTHRPAALELADYHIALDSNGAELRSLRSSAEK